MNRSRVLVLVHPTLVPPATMEGRSERDIEEMRTEFDVISVLQQSGHEVRVLGVLDSLTELRASLLQWKPQVVFNLLEEFNGIVTYDQHVVAFLELMSQPYTGCNPRGLLLARDKVLCKQLLHFHRVLTPQFAVMRRGTRLRVPRGLRWPLIVKSATEDASLGIAQASVVDGEDALRERVQFMHEQIGSDALVEEYVPGRELYVGLLGNERISRLPVWELHFGSLPANQAPIATRKVKWDLEYQRRHGISSRRAEELDPAFTDRLDRAARRVYRALHLTGYARLDFRLRDDGALYLLEANPNPNLARTEDFAKSALANGIEYPALLERIMALGMNYKVEWRQ